MKTNIIEVTVSGVTQTGKSAVMREIKDHLEFLNLAVVYADRADRKNPPDNFSDCEPHEKPNTDKTVIVISEDNQAR
jgi:hypothetical protein